MEIQSEPGVSAIENSHMIIFGATEKGLANLTVALTSPSIWDTSLGDSLSGNILLLKTLGPDSVHSCITPIYHSQSFWTV